MTPTEQAVINAALQYREAHHKFTLASVNGSEESKANLFHLDRYIRDHNALLAAVDALLKERG